MSFILDSATDAASSDHGVLLSGTGLACGTPDITTDCMAGGIVTWSSDSGSYNYSIKAQKFPAPGVCGSSSWTTGGVNVWTIPQPQYLFDPDPQIATDGQGGAIIAWIDARRGYPNYDIYAQRLDMHGNILWQKGGVPVCTAPDTKIYPKIQWDGALGAVVTWQDRRSGNFDIYAQRINGAGQCVWTKDGVCVCNATGNQSTPEISVSDTGSSFIVWSDERKDAGDIYVQALYGNGSAAWPKNGVAVCTVAGDQSWPALATEGDQVVFKPSNNPTSGDPSQNPLGGPGNTGSCYSSSEPVITKATCTGPVIAWQDARNGSYDIYSQKVSPTGTPLWLADGVSVSVQADYQEFCAVATDGLGGGLVTWTDSRSTSTDIYVQRLYKTGTKQWKDGGDPVCLAPNDQNVAKIVPDKAAGAFIAWHDYRNSTTDADVYAQRVATDGPAEIIPIVDSVTPTSAPNKGTVTLTINGSGFMSNAKVYLFELFKTYIEASNVKVTYTKITCTVNVDAVKTGLFSVLVMNTNGKTGLLPSCFTLAQYINFQYNPVPGTNLTPVPIQSVPKP